MRTFEEIHSSLSAEGFTLNHIFAPEPRFGRKEWTIQIWTNDHSCCANGAGATLDIAAARAVVSMRRNMEYAQLLKTTRYPRNLVTLEDLDL